MTCARVASTRPSPIALVADASGNRAANAAARLLSPHSNSMPPTRDLNVRELVLGAWHPPRWQDALLHIDAQHA